MSTAQLAPAAQPMSYQTHLNQRTNGDKHGPYRPRQDNTPFNFLAKRPIKFTSQLMVKPRFTMQCQPACTTGVHFTHDATSDVDAVVHITTSAPSRMMLKATGTSEGGITAWPSTNGAYLRTRLPPPSPQRHPPTDQPGRHRGHPDLEGRGVSVRSRRVSSTSIGHRPTATERQPSTPTATFLSWAAVETLNHHRQRFRHDVASCR